MLMPRRSLCHPLVGAAVVVAAIATTAASAQAANLVYWTNSFSDEISYAHLDGSGEGGELNTTGATGGGVAVLFFGVAIDPAAGKLYWANTSKNKISYANLDGSGGGDLETTGASVEEPTGVAIDPVLGRIYWANASSNKISYAKLDGSGGGDLATTGAHVNNPGGVAIDPASGTIYWANFMGNEISYANLDGSGGGGNLSTTGGEVNKPMGVAIDDTAGKIYWANREAGISYAHLDGSGGGNLVTTGANVEGPTGVAIDPAAGKIYWATFSGKKIAYANLDGSGGGGNLNTTGATPTGAFTFPALLKAPSATGAPTITGASTQGSLLSCSQGSWAADLFSDFLFQAPRSYAYAWQLNGADIPGASGATLTAFQPGLYRCRVTATNQAGSTAQTSSQVQISSSEGGSQQGRVALVSSPLATIAKLTGLSETNRTFAPASASTPLTGLTAKRHHNRGTTFSFTLDQAATVTVQIQRKGSGRLVHHACVPASKTTRRKPKCPLYTTAATLARTGHAGLNKLAFTGRIGRKALKPGDYQAVFTATHPAGSSTAQAIAFVLLAR